MSNTATFKVKEKQEVISEVTLPVPSYYRSKVGGCSYVMLHSANEHTYVRFGGLTDAIEYDGIFSFNPNDYEAITRDEFVEVYKECEEAIRSRTFANSHDNIQLSNTGS